MHYLRSTILWSTFATLILVWTTTCSLPRRDTATGEARDDILRPPEAPMISMTGSPALVGEKPNLNQLTLNESVEPDSMPIVPADQEPADLWERIRRGLQLKFHDHPDVAANLTWFRRNSDYLQRVRDRAEPWLYYIVEEIERHRLPMDMVLLPIVESAFRPHALSPDRAAGIWQFIPSTGKMYRLKESWWYNGRHDVIASTQAAISHLKRLAAIFDDDWELVLAAYNTGARRVRNAVAANKKKGKKTDFQSLKLPRETRNYVPRMQALIMVIKDPAAYGQTLQPIANEPYFTSIDIEAQLDLTVASKMAGIKTSELRRLNPGFNRWATAPNGPHRLNLPKEKKEIFITELSKMPPEKRMRWERYGIRQGDSLSRIAEQFGLTVAILQQVNDLKGTRIRAGKHLLIPVPSDASNLQGLVARLPKRPKTKKRRQKNRGYHIVRSGDSLWVIARLYNLNHKTLARWNAISIIDTLRPGQRLVTRESGDAATVQPIVPVSSEQTL